MLSSENEELGQPGLGHGRGHALTVSAAHNGTGDVAVPSGSENKSGNTGEVAK